MARDGARTSTSTFVLATLLALGCGWSMTALPETAIAQAAPPKKAQPAPKAAEPAKKADAPAKSEDDDEEDPPPAKKDTDKAADAKRKGAAEAQQGVATAAKALQTGKAEVAVQLLSRSLTSGHLTSPQMAKALFLRGQAYRKLGKPAQAVADFTSALWLKGGLSDAERAEAQAQRTAAFQEAGVAPPVKAASAPTGPSQPVVSSWPTSEKSAARTKAPADAAAPAPVPAAAPPAPAASAPPTQKKSGIGSFFSGLFGGSDQAPAKSTTVTGSTSPPAAPAPPQSAWATSTTPGTPSQAPAAAPPTKTAAAAPLAKGKFRIQVAQVRSKDEAAGVVQRIKGQHAAIAGGRETRIDETVIGSMGTFYRVQLGPFADAKSGEAACADLRRAGFDCIVVTQ